MKRTVQISKFTFHFLSIQGLFTTCFAAGQQALLKSIFYACDSVFLIMQPIPTREKCIKDSWKHISLPLEYLLE